MAKLNTKKPNSKKATKPAKVPYHRRPGELTIDQWQAALRKQFAETLSFKVQKLGAADVFCDYRVHNLDSKGTYKVALRGAEPGWNFCSCMDFKTNQLGTCKHIEYILFTINKNPKRKKILKAGYHPHYTSVYLSYGSERTVKIRIGNEEEATFQKLAVEFFDKDQTLKKTAYDHFEDFLKEAYTIHPDFRCYADALEFILEKRDFKKRNQLIDKALKQKDKFFESIIKADLFEYQKQGIEFTMRKGRSLLADDMGLGKTIQAIGAAEGLKKLQGISNVLIICPTSLKYQWKSEIEKFTGDSLTVIEGNIREREKQYVDDNFYKICSYNVVGRDLEAINSAAFDMIILDEAQRIKNWKTITAANVKKVRSKFCIVLTGTPLENKLEELYSVVQVVDPLHLGALFRFVTDHQIVDGATNKIIGYKDLDKIAVLLQDIMLRRHKRNVLKQLPSRMDKNLFVPMTERQLDYYSEANDVVVKLVNKWVRMQFLSESDRQKLLINLNIMRMACDSTYIIDQETRHDTKIDELMNILEEAFANGVEKVVVFSQWERMTRIIGWELGARNIGFASLHGGVPGKDREKLFDRFNKDDDCKIFLSTDAGGVGLNLQVASLLINMDLPWNPAVLEQRIGRIHRMGQKKNVQIINLIAAETIEEEMLNKLKFKSSMAAGILDNGESSVFLDGSKFTELMKNVQELTANNPVPEAVSDLENEQHSTIAQPTEPKSKKENKANVSSEPVADNQNQKSDIPLPEEVGSESSTLIASGADFFGRLLQTLSDPSKTEDLIESLVKKDKTTGETYLQIPVKNKEFVESGLKMLGKLFETFGK